MANHCEPAGPAIFLTTESESGVQICQVVNQFVERIAFIFERGGNREAVALLKETDDLTSMGRHAGGVHKSEPTPEQRRACGGR